MKSNFSIEGLSSSKTVRFSDLVPNARPRPSRQQLFVKGPIPLEWLLMAGRQPGIALQVGVWLWFLSGLSRSSTVFLNASRVAKEFLVSRRSVSRGLSALENVGLIRVVRCPGKKAEVTVIKDGSTKTS